MTKILKADLIAENLEDNMRVVMSEMGINPILSTIRFGNSPADISYEKGLKRSSEELNIELKVHELAIDATQEEVLELIEKLNNDDNIGGILIFRPLPRQLEEDVINKAISPLKDVDCMNPINREKVYSGDILGLIPLSPRAAVLLLEESGYNMEGKNCVVINRSNVVGKPLAMIILERGGTVTICNSKTSNLRECTRNAKFIFTAMGRAEMLDESYFTEESVVIDIGLSKNAEGKLRGDLDAKSVEGKIEAYSPVPGGVGKITNLLLLSNVVEYYCKRLSENK